MVNRTGSGGCVPNRSFSTNQKNEIKEIIKNYCNNEISNIFIEELERGINQYHFFIKMNNESEIKTGAELKKQVTEFQKTIDKLYDQLGEMSHINESMINQFYYFREKQRIPIVYKHYSWADSLQLLIQDISIASKDYLEDTKTGSRPPSWGTELQLVEALFQAIIKSKAPIKIKAGTDSTASKLINCFIRWFNIKSKHGKKRSTADTDITSSSKPLATGKSIVRAWLDFGNNKERTKEL